MPLWLSSLRQRVCRLPLRACFRPPLHQLQWQGRPHHPRSYNTALRESRQDDTDSSTNPPSHDSFDDARYLLGLTSPKDGGVYEERGHIDVSLEDLAPAKDAHRAVTQAATPVQNQQRWKGPSRTQRPNTRPWIIFMGNRQKVAAKHKSRSVTRRAKRLRPAKKGTATASWRPTTFLPLHYLAIWKRQVAKIEVNHKNVSEEEWFRVRGMPIIDPRASEWAERLLERSNDGQEVPGEAEVSLDSADPAYVWMEVALWLLAHDPNSMPTFLLATHSESYQSHLHVQDSLSYLAMHWFRSTEADRVLQLQRLGDAFCVLADREYEAPLTFFNPFFRILMLHCSDEQIQKLYRTIKARNVSTHWFTYLHFTTYFARHNDFEQAYEALMDAKDAGADLDSWHFRSNCSTMLRKSSEQLDGLRVCLRLVSQLIDIGVKLNRPMCDIIMLNAVEAGDLKTAFSVYHSLVERGLQPTESTFAVLLKGCKMNIDDAETLNETIRNAIENVAVRKSELLATEILHCLALHHSKHNPTTAVHTLTEAYAQLFDLRTLQKLGLPIPKIPQQHDEYMPPTQHALNFMIGASIDHYLERAPYTQGILPLYERWRHEVEAGEPSLANLAASDYTANIFLQAFTLRPSGLIHATRVVRDMQRPLPTSAGVNQIPPTVQSWSIFLHGFTRHGKTQLAEQVLTYMRSKGVEPNHVTWNTLVTGYARTQDEEGTVDALRRAERAGHVWDRWTYGGLKSLRNQGRLKVELERGRLRRSLDFSEEVRRGLGERLGGVDEEVEGGELGNVGASEDRDGMETRDGFADSPGEIAEQGDYRPF